MAARHSPAVQRQAIDLYLSGLTAVEVHNALGIAGGSVFNILSRHGIPSRSVSEAGRKYTANHAFFDSITTEQQAYILGMWATDGCVLDGNYVQLGFAEKDRAHLETIRDAMGSNHPVSTSVRGKTKAGRVKRFVRFIISSPELAAGLKAQGIEPRKTFTVRPWNGPAHLMHHYWRGAMDGDGSWNTYRTRAGLMYRVAFCGNRFMVRGLADFLTSRIGHTGRPRKRKAIFELQYQGRELPQAIAKVLYDGATICLPRKKAIADACLAVELKRPNRVGRLLTLNGETMRVHEWAKRLGIHRERIQFRLWLGWSAERALTTPVERGRLYLIIDGERRNVVEWSKLSGIKRTTIEERHRRGWSGQALIAPV